MQQNRVQDNFVDTSSVSEDELATLYSLLNKQQTGIDVLTEILQ